MPTLPRFFVSLRERFIILKQVPGDPPIAKPAISSAHGSLPPSCVNGYAKPVSLTRSPRILSLFIANRLDYRHLLNIHPRAAEILSQPPQMTMGRISHCLVDGCEVRTHVKCLRCDILIGPGHLEETLIDGLCSFCREKKGKR